VQIAAVAGTAYAVSTLVTPRGELGSPGTGAPDAPAIASLNAPTPSPEGREPTQRAAAPQPDAPLNAQTRLTLAIQTELTRLGCYDGRIDGDWSNATRRAMQAFNGSVRTTIPVDRSDYILLTLLQGHKTRACGLPCPAGATGHVTACNPDSRSIEAAAPRREEPAWARALADAVTPVARSDVAAAQVPAPRAPSPSIAPPEAAEDARKAAEAERRRLAELEARKRAAEAERRQQAEVARLASEAIAETTRREAEARLAERRREELASEAARPPTPDTGASGVTVTGLTSRDEPASRSGRVRVLRLAPTEMVSAAPLPTPRPALAASPGTQLPPPRPNGMATTGDSDGDNRTWAPRVATLQASDSGPSAKTENAARKPRFVGRFIPPPTYRVGRLPPRADVRVLRPMPRPTAVVRGSFAPRRSVQGIFLQTQRGSP
jgi:hypothetical protein